MTPRDGFPRFSVTSAWCGDARHCLPWALATGPGSSASGPKGLGPLDPRLRSCPALGPAYQPRDLDEPLSALFGLDAREPS